MQNTLIPTPKANSFKLTILTIENNEDNLVYVSTALELFNYHHLTTQNTMMGLALAQQHQPDLILLNAEMPTMNSIEFLQSLRIDWLTRTIPVIALTALAGSKEQEKLMEAGFDGYLFKPYLPEELESVIRHQIAHRSSC